MYSFSYSEINSSSPTHYRERERQAIQKGIDLYNQINIDKANKIDIVKACIYNRNMWTIFIEDVMHPKNELDTDLKKSIISIGSWLINESFKIQNGQLDKLTDVLEIMEIIKKGLN
jgi:flagellar biosynthesis activator protein FlaF